MSFLQTETAQAEPVEALPFSSGGAGKGKGQPFDKLRVSGFGLLVLATLTAATEPPAPGYQPGFAVPAPPAPANGAIFQSTNGYAPLTSGQRAAQVGDVLTVVLTERTQAQATAGTTTERAGNVGLLPPVTASSPDCSAHRTRGRAATANMAGPARPRSRTSCRARSA
jgi:flagellar basal body L-ring protein FlgH